ncbi:MAG: HNH endonuclease [Motiliproteus sp.]|nr:HNH endonuclease [Motiliproteus sp.]MCW9051241.1 HNH endonuclease [Motiliproteus sp.]
MPPRIPKPCRSTGCPLTTVDRSGYCDTHADKRHNWRGRQEGKTTTQRGYGHAWRKLRKQAMNRDSWLCQACLEMGRVTPATEVDHVIPKADGGTDRLSNLRAICKPCHQDKTQQDSRGGAGQKSTD